MYKIGNIVSVQRTRRAVNLSCPPSDHKGKSWLKTKGLRCPSPLFSCRGQLVAVKFPKRICECNFRCSESQVHRFPQILWEVKHGWQASIPSVNYRRAPECHDQRTAPKSPIDDSNKGLWESAVSSRLESLALLLFISHILLVFS